MSCGAVQEPLGGMGAGLGLGRGIGDGGLGRGGTGAKHCGKSATRSATCAFITRTTRSGSLPPAK